MHMEQVKYCLVPEQGTLQLQQHFGSPAAEARAAITEATPLPLPLHSQTPPAPAHRQEPEGTAGAPWWPLLPLLRSCRTAGLAQGRPLPPLLLLLLLPLLLLLLLACQGWNGKQQCDPWE